MSNIKIPSEPYFDIDDQGYSYESEFDYKDHEENQYDYKVRRNKRFSQNKKTKVKKMRDKEE